MKPFNFRKVNEQAQQNIYRPWTKGRKTTKGRTIFVSPLVLSETTKVVGYVFNQIIFPKLRVWFYI